MAISAGLSALMVVSSLGVAPAMAFAGQNPTSTPAGQTGKQPKQQDPQPTVNFGAISAEDVMTNAGKLSSKPAPAPESGNSELPKITSEAVPTYLGSTEADSVIANASKLSFTNFSGDKENAAAISDIASLIGNDILPRTLADAGTNAKDAQSVLKEKNDALLAAQQKLDEVKAEDPYAGLAADATEAAKAKAAATHDAKVQLAQEAVQEAQSAVTTATQELKNVKYTEASLKLIQLKKEFNNFVPRYDKLPQIKEWLAGRVKQYDDLRAMSVKEFVAAYKDKIKDLDKMTEEQQATQLEAKKTEVSEKIVSLKNDIAAIEAKIKAVEEGTDVHSGDYLRLKNQVAALEKELESYKITPAPAPKPEAKPSISDVLGGLSADDILNSAAKLNIKPIDELVKPAPEVTVDAIEKALATVDAEKIADFKLNKEVTEAIKKDLASTYNNNNSTETPGSSSDTTTPDSNQTPGSDQTPAPDQTPASDNSGDAANDQAPEGKEEAKAQAEKTPKTGDFFAALLPMLGVALGGTSIAFGKRMRH